MKKIKADFIKLLRWSEKYLKTDMVYLFHGGSWLTLGKIVSGASAFVLAIVLGNVFSQETYGIYTYATLIGGLLSISTLTEMETSVARSVAQGHEGIIYKALETKIKWGLLGIIAGLTVSIYYFAQGNVSLGLIILIVAIFNPLSDTFGIYGALFSGRKLFKDMTQYGIVNQIIPVAVMAATALITKNITWFMFAYFASYATMKTISLVVVLKKYKPNTKTDSNTISYGKHLSAMGIIGQVAAQADQFLMWHFLGAAPLAVFSFAVAPISQLNSFMKSLDPLAFPKFAGQNKEEIKKHLPHKMIKMFFIVALIVAGYIIFIPLFYKIFFPKYIAAINYSRLYVLTLLFFPQKMMGTALTAHEQKKALYIINGVNPIIKMALLLVLIPLYGINGAIVANIIPYAANTFVLGYFFKRM